MGIALGFASLGSTYTLPQVTQGALGFTPTESGLLFIMRALPILLVTFPVVRLLRTIDPRILVGSGFALLAFANELQAIVTTSQASFWSFAWPLIISGAGSAILYVPLTTAVLASTTQEEGHHASAFMTLVNTTGWIDRGRGARCFDRSTRKFPFDDPWFTHHDVATSRAIFAATGSTTGNRRAGLSTIHDIIVRRCDLCRRRPSSAIRALSILIA